MLFFYYIELYGGTQVQLHKKLEKARTNHNTQWCGCVFYLRLCFFFPILLCFFSIPSCVFCYVLLCVFSIRSCVLYFRVIVWIKTRTFVFVTSLQRIYLWTQSNQNTKPKRGKKKKRRLNTPTVVCALFASITQHLPYRESGNEAHLTSRTAPESQKKKKMWVLFRELE